MTYMKLKTQHMFTYVLQMFYMCFTCVLHVFYMCFTCVLHVFNMCFLCVLICVFMQKYMYIRQVTLRPPTVSSFWT